MSDKPNILFILTDDQGAWAMNCAGTKELRTPNLDRLAAEGTRFENFFCASPVCSPARASIITGRIPSQHGVHDFLYWSKTVPGANTESIKFLEGQTSYIDILVRNGYSTYLSGKWHLGYAMEPQSGYEDWSALPSGGCPYYKPIMAEGGEMVDHSGEYSSDLFTDNAIKYLDSQKGSDKPFCLHVHYTAPHSPWEREHHPKELWDDYFNNCKFESVPDESLPEGYTNSRKKNAEERRASLAGYFAAITAMDANVGRLLEWLDENGERDNTLIVFMADNGMNMGHHGMYGKGNGSWPQNLFDTSVKVPCIISRPGHVAQGHLEKRLLSQYDWLPTALDYVGLADQTPEGLPGKSFAPVLRGEAAPERENVVVFDEYGPVRMIRSHEWKLVWRYPAGFHELYHLTKDPEEKNNLFDYKGNLDRIREMRQELDEWFAQYVDPKIDGTKLEITGRGQKDRAEVQGAFLERYPDDWLPENKDA
ncbi:MAG: sulfatase [Candidatus Sumerlaeia bacterium]